MPARPAALAAVAAASLLAGCSTVPEGKSVSAEERDRCRKAFALCPPPARFAPTTKVANLEVRKLVVLAARIDVGKLSPAAAKRLHELATGGDKATLLEIEAAIDDTETTLGKCRCPADPPELEKKKIRELVAARLPSRELRSPATWVERVFAKLSPIRELRRRAVEQAIAGEAAPGLDLDGAVRAADRELCEEVHGARDVLSREEFGGMLDSVYERQATEVGAGSAEAARRLLDGHAASSACGAEAG
jgi:hypothetical protein